MRVTKTERDLAALIAAPGKTGDYAWAVLGQGGMILRRGHDLEQVLRFFDRGRFKVVD